MKEETTSTHTIERHLADEAARQTGVYNRSLIEASLDPLFTIAPNGKITDVNNAAEKVTGLSREQLIGTDFADYFTDPGRARAGYEQVFREGLVQDYGLEIRRCDGHVTPVLYSAAVYRDDAGQVIGVCATARDVTELKRAVEAVRRASAYNRSLLEASLDPLLTINPDGKITDVNNAAEKVTGLSRQQLMGTDFADYFSDPGKARAGYEQVFREGLINDYELEIRHRDGYVTPVLYNAAVYRDEAGEVIGVFAAARHISERKRAEEEIRKLNQEIDERVRRHTAELEATNKNLEAFTYSVSHDLRSPLRHIDGFSKLLLEEYSVDLPEDARRYLSRIREGTRRMGMMVDDLLNLTRVGRKELSMQLTGLSSLLEEAIRDLKPEMAGREIEWRIGKLPFVECDPALVKQVFANLLSNALKFTRLRERAVIEVGETRQDGRAVIFVRDNGVGFSMKYVDKLFGVFQRLHRPEDFEGTGIGLATVQRIVHKHGGRTWAEGELNKGATFYFTLEAVESRPGESNSLPRGAA
jgi:PAS domain S-box-containing protein